MTGVGSGSGVIAPALERNQVFAPDFAALTAAALPPVTDAAQPGCVQRLIVESDTHRADDVSVEHIRQSRLQRWQRQVG